MADNGLTPRGDLYQRRLCVTHEGAEAQMQVLTRIPLRREEGPGTPPPWPAAGEGLSRTTKPEG